MKILLLNIIGLAFGILAAWADDPPLVSICDLRQGGFQSGDQAVIHGVCTCETGRFGENSTIVTQENGGVWCSILLYDGSGDLIALRGECVTAVVIIQEYYDRIDFIVSNSEVDPECFPAPSPMWIPTGLTNLEPYEFCLIENWCVTVTDNPDDFGVFHMDDGSGPLAGLFASDWPQPAQGDFFCRITGILDFAWGQFRLRPRDLNDLDMTPVESCGYGAMTATPTAVYSPTATPVISMTSTQTSQTATPPPSATPPSGNHCQVELNLNQEYFRATDAFSLTVLITPYVTPLHDVFLAVLDVYGGYYFYPGWSQTLAFEQLNYPADSLPNILLSFVWPSGAGAADHLFFYGAVANPALTILTSNLGIAEFGFGL